jgi:DNA-directed RNA polymerase specialized sigma24 family protein
MTETPAPKRDRLDELYRLIYDELRDIADAFVRRKLTGKHRRTSLVHESYVKLSANAHPEVEGEDHLKRLMARAMRFVCTDWHREDNALKRGGGQPSLSLSDTNLGELGESRDSVSDYVDLYDALLSFEVVHPEMAPLIEGWLLWECTDTELAKLYGVTLAQARAALRMFKRHLDRST